MSHPIPSARPGMGAIPYDGGVAFRVWAPHADSVSVMGDFNEWSKTAHPLADEENGCWSANVTGAKIGDEYKYLIINGAKELHRIDPYAKEVTNSIGNAIVYDPQFEWQEDYQPPSWEEMIIYEMHVGTFNDLIPDDEQPGNLNSAIEKLSYLKHLGINTVQIMPPMEFAMDYSWGYNPAHIFAIESAYGGGTAFKEFIKAAHTHGIAIIFDVVYNHWGPSDLDLWQFDGWSKNDKGGIYFYNDWRSHTQWGDTRPDYGRQEVRQYIYDNALMWLEEYRVDGLRWDATAYIRDVYGRDNDDSTHLADGWSLMQWVNDEINTRYPWKINIAEDLRDNSWITKDSFQGGAGFDSQWDGSFVHPIREALIVVQDEHRNLNAVRDAIYHRYDDDVFKRVIYTESHDEVANGKARVPYEIWPDDAGCWYAQKRSTLGAALVFTAPGIPMIFQGQEFLEDEWFHDKDPVDWDKKRKYQGIVTLYRDLIRLRRNWYNNTRGLQGQNVHVHHLNHQDKVIAFHRWDEGGPEDDVVVVANLANQSYESYTIGFPAFGQWRVRFNSDWEGYSDSFKNHSSFDTFAERGDKDNMPYHGNVGLGPYTVIVLSQDGPEE